MCQNVNFYGGHTIHPFRDKMFTGLIVTEEKCHHEHSKCHSGRNMGGLNIKAPFYLYAVQKIQKVPSVHLKSAYKYRFCICIITHSLHFLTKKYRIRNTKAENKGNVHAIICKL
jgi:hypothetical protein